MTIPQITVSFTAPADVAAKALVLLAGLTPASLTTEPAAPPAAPAAAKPPARRATKKAAT